MYYIKKNLSKTVCCLMLGLAPQLAWADVSKMLNYQGYLTDKAGTPMDNKAVEVTLTFWNAQTGGSTLGNPKSYVVEVNNGVFSQNIDVSDVEFEGPVYLEIMVENETLNPRQLLTSVPSSLLAHEAEQDQDTLAQLKCNKDQIAKWNGTQWICADYGQNGSKLPPPDYESDWFTMKSQAGEASFKELTHGLGVYPSKVKVLTKAIDGPNKGFIFEAMGAAQNDDDDDHSNYGGLIFGYNDQKVRLWAPDKNNHNPNGKIINVGTDGWGGEKYSYASNSCLVKVKIWK